MKRISLYLFDEFPFNTANTDSTETPDPRIKSEKQILSEIKNIVTEISPTELNNKIQLKENFILLDIRTERERSAGYIGNSFWIPRGTIEFKIKEVCVNAEIPIVVYCKKGYRSALAAITLKDLGYTKVVNLSGGIDEWSETGYPIYNWHGKIKVIEIGKTDPDLKDYNIF